jgi:hypothetical protein
MANLVIAAEAVAGTVGVQTVTIELTDLDGVPVVGYKSDDSSIVVPYQGVTDSSGDLTVSLEPNANLTPENTYYTVKIRNWSWLIEKGANSENLLDAVVSSPSALGEAEARPVEVVKIMVGDMTTDLTTGDGKAGFIVPTKLNGWNLIRAHAGLLTAQSTSGVPTVQIRNATQTADMLTTKVTIDANEWTSHTAAAAPVVDAANDDVATGDRILVDVDVAGTGAQGLVVILEFQGT